MNRLRRSVYNLFIILSCGLISAIVCQFTVKTPTDRYIHITSFRYGKEPSVIRCNRGDRLHITFSTNDTGHSFFLEEFNIDVKVSPAREEVSVFKTSDPTGEPVITKEVTITAKHPGMLNYIVSKSNYRCHVWCGPMHAFEQGKLIILPNTLLLFSLGCLIGIIIVWILRIFRNNYIIVNPWERQGLFKDLLGKNNLLKEVISSRWLQIAFIIIAMVMIYLVILISSFGTKVSGRNLGVLLMWSVWLFLLVTVMTPLGGRIWCTICPLPFIGDYIQRGSFFIPGKGKTKEFNNRYSGFFLKWPERLSNHWLKLIVFLVLATFSTTLVAVPRASGITVLMLLIVPTLMAAVWELRAFCRYVCPVSVFVSPYSGFSPLALRNKSQTVCDQCKPHYCLNGSKDGWACPYGINVGELKVNSDCGLCLECMRSCLYNNVSLYRRPFGLESDTRSISEAWMHIAIFTISIIYSILYLGHWPVIRDYVNIIDKHNWDLFGIYTLIVWILTLVVVPGTIWLLSYAGKKSAGVNTETKSVFMHMTGTLRPLGLMIWIAFVIPMLFVNTTFIRQSFSDPFGWGWNFFGAANTPWHQFLPRYIPWLQAILVLVGLYLSLSNICKTWLSLKLNSRQLLKLALPFSLFVILAATAMIFFFTN